MGNNVECRPSTEQRGSAAHLRQIDDNHRREILTRDERQFCNSIIHSPSTNHGVRPGVNEELASITNKTRLCMIISYVMKTDIIVRVR
jgi:hypothetical protein